MGEFQWMNAPAAAEKRLSLVLNARGQEKDLRDFSPKNARNALGRESALVPSVVAPASFKLRHNQTDYEPRYIPAPVSRQSGARRVPGKNCYAELFPELVAAAKALQAERQRLADSRARMCSGMPIKSERAGNSYDLFAGDGGQTGPLGRRVKRRPGGWGGSNASFAPGRGRQLVPGRPGAGASTRRRLGRRL